MINTTKLGKIRLLIDLPFYNCHSLVPRFISQAFIAWSMVLCAFHTASDKSLGDKPGNEATYMYTALHCIRVVIHMHGVSRLIRLQCSRLKPAILSGAN